LTARDYSRSSEPARVIETTGIFDVSKPIPPGDFATPGKVVAVYLGRRNAALVTRRQVRDEVYLPAMVLLRERTYPGLGIIEPCLPSREGPPSGLGWIHEIKYDGFRIQGRRNAAGVRLNSRKGNDLTRRFPFIAMAVESLPVKSCLIDGEVIACDKIGLADFDLIRGHGVVASGVHCAFDLLELDGRDLRREPVEKRKGLLAKLLKGLHCPQRAFQGGRRDRVSRSGPARLRAHRVEAARFDLPLRAQRALAQDQKPSRVSREGRGRGGLEPLPAAFDIAKRNQHCAVNCAGKGNACQIRRPLRCSQGGHGCGEIPAR
jgi:ATP dependent DNA ligase domain